MRPRPALLVAAALVLLPRLAAAQPNPCAPKPPGLRSHMLRVVAKEEPKPPVVAAARPKPPTRPVAQAPKPPERCNVPKSVFGGVDEDAVRTASSFEPGPATLPARLRLARRSPFRPATVFLPGSPARAPTSA